MIFDTLKNLKLYNIEPEIVDFLWNLDFEIPIGRHTVSKNAYVNIEEYQTRQIPKPEAHNAHIDIQFLIKGEEKVFVTKRNGLNVCEEYDAEKDVTFFDMPKKPVNTLYLCPGDFLLLYPDDVHAPCITPFDTPLDVKKGIVKIKI